MTNFIDNILDSMFGSLEGWNGTLTQLGNSLPAHLGAVLNNDPIDRNEGDFPHQITTDLHRQPCLLTHSSEAGSFFETLSRTHNKGFVQGQWDARVIVDVILKVPLFSFVDSAPENEPVDLIKRADESYKTLSFAYRNDQDETCGFSIATLSGDKLLRTPDGFIACVMKNVTSAREVIECSLFATPSCMNLIKDLEKNAPLYGNTIATAFRTSKRSVQQLYSALNCDALKNIVAGLLNDDNTINHSIDSMRRTFEAVKLDDSDERNPQQLLCTTFSNLEQVVQPTAIPTTQHTSAAKRSHSNTLQHVLFPTVLTSGSGIVGATKLGATLAATKTGAAIGAFLGHGICSLPGAMIGACLGLIFSLISACIFTIVNKLRPIEHTTLTRHTNEQKSLTI